MHLIEQYALSCGVKIDKPVVETSYFPIDCEKYITLHASSGMEAKNYDYFTDVITLISPYLEQKNIKIIQIGDRKDKKLEGCIHYNGTTNLKQSFYLIKNSILHCGNDSFSSHVASGFNKKIVCLYSVLFKECCGPYWGDKEDHVLLEPSRIDRKPSFSPKESPKTVNEIDPEEIACGILDLLEINHELKKVKTIHIGQEYHIPSIAVIPNHVMPETYIKNHPINIHGEECFDELNIVKWVRGRKANIFLDKQMNINYLGIVRENINQINYFLSEETNVDYIKTLSKLGFPVQLLCNDQEKINDIRLKFFDWNVLKYEQTSKKDLDNIDLLCDNSFYQSSRKIISNGKVYNSKAAWIHEKEGDHKEIIDCEEFWQELKTIKIYNDARNT
tara:strand:- start:72310 stop:73476 length:1167 start_codon:yes stop_codon:yes gene_type:complete